VALRVPAHPLALAVLKAFRGGIAAPSANRFGRLSPTTAAHVLEELGNQVDVILDGGPCAVGVESSIVDVTGPAPRLLRPGGLAREALEAVLGRPLVVVQTDPAMRAPGMLASHYAPRAGVLVVDPGTLEGAVREAQGRGQRLVALIPEGTALRAGVPRLTVPTEATAFARILYSRLREADAAADLILVVPPAASGLGLAVRDRLRRAAAPRPTS
jgi:L-threonylcarbamoyladenylate synthase